MKLRTVPDREMIMPTLSFILLVVFAIIAMDSKANNVGLGAKIGTSIVLFVCGAFLGLLWVYNHNDYKKTGKK